VFFSSHVLGQVELVCDRVGVLHEGRLVASGSVDALRETADVGPDATMESIFVSLTDGDASALSREADR